MDLTDFKGLLSVQILFQQQEAMILLPHLIKS